MSFNDSPTNQTSINIYDKVFPKNPSETNSTQPLLKENILGDEDHSLNRLFKEYVFNAEQSENEYKMKINSLSKEVQLKDKYLRELIDQAKEDSVRRSDNKRNVEKTFQEKLEKADEVCKLQKEEILKLQNCIAEVKRDYQESLSNLKDSDKHQAEKLLEYQNQINSLKKSLDVLETERDDIIGENQRYIETLKSMKQKELQHLHNMKRASVECERILQLYRSSEQQREELKKKCDSLQLHNEQLKEQLQNTVDLKNTMAIKINSLIEDKSNNTALTSLENESKSLHGQINDLHDEIKRKRKTEDKLYRNIDELQKSLEEKNEKISNLSKELDDGRSREENMQSDIFRLQKKEIYKQNNEELEKTLNDLKLKLTVTEEKHFAEKQNLVTELENTKLSLQQYKQIESKLNNEISILCSKLENAEEILRRENEKYTKALEAFQNTNQLLHQRNKELESFNEKQNEEIKSLLIQLEQKEALIKRSNELNFEKDSNYKNIESTITALKTNLKKCEKEKEKVIYQMNEERRIEKQLHMEEIAKQKQTCKELEGKFNEITSLLKETKSHCLKYQNDAETLYTKNNQLEKELQNSFESIKKLENHIKSLKIKNKKLMNDSSVLLNKNNEIYCMIKQLQTDNDSLTIKLNQASEINGNLLNNLNNAEDLHSKDVDTIFHLQAALSQLDYQFSTLMQDKEILEKNLQEQITKLKSEYEEKDKRLDSFKTNYDDLQTRYDRLLENHDNKTTEKTENKEILHEKIRELEKMKADIERKCYNEITDYKSKTSELLSSLSKLESHLKNITEEKNILIDKLKQKTDENEAICKNFQSLSFNSEKTERELNKYKNKIENIQNDYMEVSAKLTESDNDSQKKTNEIIQLKKQLLENNLMQKEYSSRISANERLIQEQQEEIKNSSLKIHSLEDKEKTLTNEKQLLNQELYHLKNQLGKLNESSQEEINKLKSYLLELEGRLEGNKQKNQIISQVEKKITKEVNELKKLVSKQQAIILEEKEKSLKLQSEKEKLEAIITMKENEYKKLYENYRLLKKQSIDVSNKLEEKNSKDEKQHKKLKEKERQTFFENEKLKEVHAELENEIQQIKSTLHLYEEENSNYYQVLKEYKEQENKYVENKEILEEKTIELHRQFIQSINLCKHLKTQNFHLKTVIQEGCSEKENYEAFMKRFRTENNNLRCKLKKFYFIQQELKEKNGLLEEKLKETNKINESTKFLKTNQSRKTKVDKVKKKSSLNYRKKNINTSSQQISLVPKVPKKCDILKLADSIEEFKAQGFVKINKKFLKIQPEAQLFPKASTNHERSKQCVLISNRKATYEKSRKVNLDKSMTDWMESYDALLSEMNDLSSKLSFIKYDV